MSWSKWKTPKTVSKLECFLCGWGQFRAGFGVFGMKEASKWVQLHITCPSWIHKGLILMSCSKCSPLDPWKTPKFLEFWLHWNLRQKIHLPYVWLEFTTPKLRELISWDPALRISFFLFASSPLVSGGLDANIGFDCSTSDAWVISSLKIYIGFVK